MNLERLGRGMTLGAVLFAALIGGGCQKNMLQDYVAYERGDQECPACGATPAGSCRCRPDGAIGGYRPTAWAHTSPNEFPQAQAQSPLPSVDQAANVALATSLPQEDSPAALPQTEPAAMQADKVIPAISPFTESAESRLNPETVAAEMTPIDHIRLASADASEPTEVRLAKASEPVTPSRAEAPAVQLAAREESVPTTLPDERAPVADAQREVEPTVDTESSIELVDASSYPSPTCKQQGDAAWLQNHRYAQVPAEFQYRFRAAHWRSVPSDVTLEEPAAENALEAEPVSVVIPNQTWPARSVPAPPPVKSGETPARFVAAESPESMPEEVAPPLTAECETCQTAPMADMACQSCTSGNECTVCDDCNLCDVGPPPVYLLDRLKGALHSHKPKRCAAAPDATCFGYHATQWRQMTDICSKPNYGGLGGYGHGPYGPELVPAPDGQAPAGVPGMGQETELPPLVLPQFEQLPPADVPLVPPVEREPPALPQPQPDYEGVPDLFPKNSEPESDGHNVVRFNPQWRSSTGPQPVTPDTNSTKSPARDRSAANRPLERRELRFAPTQNVGPVSPVGHEQDLWDEQE